MPIENRSSYTEMASVPTLLAADNDRDMLEYLAEAVETQTYVCDHCAHEEPLSTFDIASDLREYMLAFPQAPAPQPHPEPIAWMVGTALWWTKEEAERDAAATGLPIVGLGPMTDRAAIELAESETMAAMAELAECEAMADMVAEREWAEHVGTGSVSSKVESAFTQLHNDLHEAGEKLAERDALLRELADAPPAAMEFRLQQKVKAALSASAEPQVKS